MDTKETKKAAARLSEFVKALAKSRVRDKEAWKRWKARAGNEQRMEKWFGYKRKGKMPAISALVKPFFHPELPLVGLNYTPVAHNVLHAIPGGWTTALRLCRGIVFDRKGNLVAKPFPKFFNHGEHEESRNLPDGPIFSTEKMDGHLGIIFEYAGRFIITTRGSFVSRTSVTAAAMLAAHVEFHGWRHGCLAERTLLVEVIHPETKVHVDYGDRVGFVLLGAYDNATLECVGDMRLEAIGEALGLELAETRVFASVDDLKAHMRDRSVLNREGVVGRLPDDRFVKFKFETYIGRMVQAKLNYTYLMNRAIAGNLDRMLSTLDEEIMPTAHEMIAALHVVAGMRGDLKARHAYLYGLDPEKEKNAYYRGVCRKFLTHVDSPKAKKKA